jgi:hypothetical protein
MHLGLSTRNTKPKKWKTRQLEPGTELKVCVKMVPENVSSEEKKFFWFSSKMVIRT